MENKCLLKIIVYNFDTVAVAIEPHTLQSCIYFFLKEYVAFDHDSLISDKLF